MGERESNLTIKTFSGWEIKDEDKGEVEAVVATVGVIDHDGDIIRKDSLPNNAKAAMSDYGHSLVFGKRPVGKGGLFVEGNKLKFAGRLFLDTTDGLETFKVLKAMGPDQQWSFGFFTLGSEVPTEEQRKQGAFRIITKMDPFEVSPVFRGAGIGTQTLAVKELVTAESQADGAVDADESDDALVAEVLAAIAARRLEAKQKKDEELATAEAARLAAETKAAEEAEAARLAPLIAMRDRYLATVDAHAPSPQREFERFQKTMQRMHRTS